MRDLGHPDLGLVTDVRGEEEGMKLEQKPVSAAKAKVGGALFVVGGLVMAYFFMLRPLQEAQRTGHLEYYFKGILLPPALVYGGLVVLVFDMRDGQTRTAGPDGKPKLTAKGWWFIGGLFVVMGLTVGGWLWYLHAIGFESGI
jgi:hypothetical protein